MKPTDSKESIAQEWQAFDALETSVSDSWEAVLQAKLDRSGKRKTSNIGNFSVLLLLLVVVNGGALLLSMPKKTTPAVSRLENLQIVSNELLSTTNN